MFGSAIWDKLHQCILAKFEISQVQRRQFQNFQKLHGRFIPKFVRTKYVVTN